MVAASEHKLPPGMTATDHHHRQRAGALRTPLAALRFSRPRRPGHGRPARTVDAEAIRSSVQSRSCAPAPSPPRSQPPTCGRWPSSSGWRRGPRAAGLHSVWFVSVPSVVELEGVSRTYFVGGTTIVALTFRSPDDRASTCRHHGAFRLGQVHLAQHPDASITHLGPTDRRRGIR
jgi:hypothetical protein